MDRDRLKIAMEEAGLSQAELARRSNVSSAAIQQLLNGTAKRTRALPAIAEALGVTSDWLDGRDGPRERGLNPVISPGDKNLIEVPYLFTASDGMNPSEDDDSFQIFTMSESFFYIISGNKIRKDGYLGAFLIKMDGEKMSPTLMPNDVICVRSCQSHDGDPDAIWVFNYNKNAMIRRLRVSDSGTFTISADNPLYPPFVAGAGEIVISGKVVWQGRRLSP